MVNRAINTFLLTPENNRSNSLLLNYIWYVKNKTKVNLLS